MTHHKRDLAGLIKKVKGYAAAEKEAGMDEVYIPAKSEQLSLIYEEALNCKECGLCKTRKNMVFGVGNPDADLVFVGEAPGREEDKQGEPFVGEAGELLTRIIEAIGLKRSEVYITNVLRCRPPANRNPLPQEVDTCLPYLARQLEIIKPKVICALGKFAAQSLLQTQIPITRLRGKFQSYHNIKVMPTFHPAYLLRNPSDKKLVWEDMKKIRDCLK